MRRSATGRGPGRRSGPVPIVAGAAAALWAGSAAWGLPRALGAGGLPAALGLGGSAPPLGPGGSAPAFHNTVPTPVMLPGSTASLLRGMLTRGRQGRPTAPVPLVAASQPARAGELAVTWYGHSSVLVDCDGARVLLDPVWGRRVSPSRRIGPRRLHPVPVPLAALPRLDAIVISHDHYDHLDLPTVDVLRRTQRAPFVVPSGVGAHLRRWGVPASRIVELGWAESVELGGLELTCVEARHFSGRGLRRDPTLWAAWVLGGPRHRVYFGGDTGYTPAFAGIGARHGPFDVSLLPIGAYADQWPSIHLDPEEAVRAHGDLDGGLLVPIHWATFDLALHPWAEPVQRLAVACAAAGVPWYAPRPGERVEPRALPVPRQWWAGPAGP